MNLPNTRVYSLMIKPIAMNLKLILVTAFAGLFLCSCSNTNEPAPENRPHAEAGHATVHTAPNTVMNYESFTQGYHPTWKGQEVTVQGIYMNLTVGSDSTGAIGNISLYGEGDFTERFVSCVFEQNQIAGLRELIQGDTITVNGVVGTHLNSDVELSKCSLVLTDSTSSQMNTLEI